MPPNTSFCEPSAQHWFSPVNDWPEWLGRETLPGGFLSDTPPAGGALLEWEQKAFAEFNCKDRLELNRFFTTPAGRQALRKNYWQGSFSVEQPEEAALMAFALAEHPADELTLLEPYFERVRFYPRLLEVGFSEPSPGQVFRYSCSDVLEQLNDYSLPLEVQRKRESASLWSPYFHRMLAMLEETVEEDWPFQCYPSDWADRARKLVTEIEQAVSEDVFCAYPHRADSDFRRLLAHLATACEKPSKLTGREVSFCRTLWKDTLSKRGKLRPEVPRDLPGDDVLHAIEKLKARLQDFPPQGGVSDSDPWLHELPPPVKRKVLKAHQGTLSELQNLGLINSLEILEELVPKVVAGVFDCPLLSRTYKTFSMAERATQFESLPWIEDSWQPPDPNRIERAASDLLNCWWSVAGYRDAPRGLARQLQTLARWHGQTDWRELAAKLHPELDLDAAAEQCRSFISQQQTLRCPKPYQRVRRDKRVKTAERQLAFFQSRVRVQVSPSSKSVRTNEPDL